MIIYIDKTMEDMIKTSWSDSDLEKLTNPKNHRIRFDGYEYVWEHKINKSWERHAIHNFEDYKRPYVSLQSWLWNWSKELMERKMKQASDYFKDMETYLKNTKKVLEIKNGPYKTKKKIQMIQELMPSETVTFIADVLDISRQAVHKHI